MCVQLHMSPVDVNDMLKKYLESARQSYSSADVLIKKRVLKHLTVWKKVFITHLHNMYVVSLMNIVGVG